MRGDLDNYIKLTCDYLVSRGLTGDDRHNVKVTVESDPDMEVRFCWVTVTEAP
jgi:Holliday junction resolvase RusA-like endonuclease